MDRLLSRPMDGSPRWMRVNPMGGIGLNVTKHFGIDTAVFSTISNAQQDRRASIAVSLRVE